MACTPAESRLAPLGNTFETFGPPPRRQARSRSFAGYVPYSLQEQRGRSGSRSSSPHAPVSSELVSTCGSNTVESLEPEVYMSEPWPDTDDEDDECNWSPSSHLATIPLVQMATSDGMGATPYCICTHGDGLLGECRFDGFSSGGQFGNPAAMTSWETMSFTTLPVSDPSCLGEAGSSPMAEYWAGASPPLGAWTEQPGAALLELEFEGLPSPLPPPAEQARDSTEIAEALPTRPSGAPGLGPGEGSLLERDRAGRRQPAAPRAPGGASGVTTLMLRNLPKWLTQDNLVSEIHLGGFEGRLDFCYMPRDLNSKLGRGHGFVNFTTPAAAVEFQGAWHQKKQWSMVSQIQAPINISTAAVQGLAANMGNPKRLRVRNPLNKPFVLEGKANDLGANPDGQ